MMRPDLWDDLRAQVAAPEAWWRDAPVRREVNAGTWLAFWNKKLRKTIRSQQ